LVLVEEAPHPALVVEAALDLDHPLRTVVLEESLLLVVGLPEEGQRGAHAPGPVVLLRPEIQLVEAPVGVDPQRVFLEHERMLAHGGLDLIGRLVELREDLPLDDLVALEAGRHLEGLDGAVRILQAVAVDETEVVPEVELEIRGRNVRRRHAAEHLPEGALESLEVLLRGEDLVDALEGLEVLRIEIEGLAEELHRSVLVALL